MCPGIARTGRRAGYKRALMCGDTTQTTNAPRPCNEPNQRSFDQRPPHSYVRQVQTPGWHAVAVVIHRPSTSRLRNVAASAAFLVASATGSRDEEVHSAAFEKFPASDGGRACARDRRFFIHVLAFDRPEAIQTLLTSLARSDYNGTGDIINE